MQLVLLVKDDVTHSRELFARGRIANLGASTFTIPIRAFPCASLSQHAISPSDLRPHAPGSQTASVVRHAVSHKTKHSGMRILYAPHTTPNAVATISVNNLCVTRQRGTVQRTDASATATESNALRLLPKVPIVWPTTERPLHYRPLSPQARVPSITSTGTPRSPPTI